MVYILCITFWKCQDTQTLFEIYLILTYIESLSRLSFLCFFYLFYSVFPNALSIGVQYIPSHFNKLIDMLRN